MEKISATGLGGSVVEQPLDENQSVLVDLYKADHGTAIYCGRAKCGVIDTGRRRRADGSPDGTIFIPTKNAGQAYAAGLGGVTMTVSSWDTHEVPEAERFPTPDFTTWKRVYWNLPDTVGVMSHGYRRAGNKSDTL